MVAGDLGKLAKLSRQANLLEMVDRGLDSARLGYFTPTRLYLFV
jgi:hypothetical protein